MSLSECQLAQNVLCVSTPSRCTCSLKRVVEVADAGESFHICHIAVLSTVFTAVLRES